MGIFSEIFKKYGAKSLIAGALIFTFIWILAHFMAAPGGSVSLLWGLVEYTKRGQLAMHDNSLTSEEIVLTPKQHRLLAIIAEYQKSTGRDHVTMRHDGYSDEINFRDELYGTDKPSSSVHVQAVEFPKLVEDIPEIYLRHYSTYPRGFKVAVTEEGLRYLSKND